MIEIKETDNPEHFTFTESTLDYRFEHDAEAGGMVRTDLLPPRPQRSTMGPTKLVYLRDEAVEDPWRVPADTEVIETRGHTFRPTGEMIAGDVEVWEPSE